MTCRSSKTHKVKQKKKPHVKAGSAIKNARKRNYTRNTVYCSPNNRVYRKKRVQKLRYTTIYDSHASHQCVCFRRFPFACVSCLLLDTRTTIRSCCDLAYASSQCTSDRIRHRAAYWDHCGAYTRRQRFFGARVNSARHFPPNSQLSLHRIQGLLRVSTGRKQS